jgi:hypothetical protein
MKIAAKVKTIFKKISKGHDALQRNCKLCVAATGKI